MPKKQPNMQRWSDDKLDKELAFALAGRPQDDTEFSWLKALVLELSYRFWNAK